MNGYEWMSEVIWSDAHSHTLYLTPSPDSECLVGVVRASQCTLFLHESLPHPSQLGQLPSHSVGLSGDMTFSRKPSQMHLSLILAYVIPRSETLSVYSSLYPIV